MIRLQFLPFPVLETERLTLRRITMDDAPMVQALRSNAQVNQFLDRPDRISLEEAQAHVEKIFWYESEKAGILWMLCLKDSLDCFGSLGFWDIKPNETSAQIGYEMHPDFYGKSYMREALEAILAYGFLEIGFSKVLAYTDLGNLASRGLLERVGFGLDGEVWVLEMI